MNAFIQQIVNQKVNTITAQELINYAKNYNISLKKQEADSVIRILRSEHPINVKDSTQHKKIIRRVYKEISPTLAKKADQLLSQFSNQL